MNSTLRRALPALVVYSDGQSLLSVCPSLGHVWLSPGVLQYTDSEDFSDEEDDSDEDDDSEESRSRCILSLTTTDSDDNSDDNSDDLGRIALGDLIMNAATLGSLSSTTTSSSDDDESEVL